MQSVKRFTVLVFSVILIAVIALQSCVRKTIDLDNMGDQQWQPNLAAPLIYTSLTISDIITKSGAQGSITIGGNNFCTLVYQGNLFSFMAKDLFVLPPQVYTQTVTLNAGQVAALTTTGSVTVSFSQTINFNSGPLGPQVDSLIYKSGILTDSIVSDFPHNATIKIDIPGAVKAGMPFSTTLNVNYGGSGPVTAKNSIDLQGYRFDMTNGGITNNQFVINYTVTIKTASGTPATPANTITIVQKCPNPLFDKIFGYIGQQSIVPAGKDLDTVALSIFKNSLQGGSFTLDSFRLRFILSNSFGVPIKADLQQLKTYTPPATTSGNLLTSTLPVKTPTFSQIGQSLKDSVSFDNATNPGLLTEINKNPQNIIYQVSAQSNPSGKAPNFIIDTSRVRVDMALELPLYGTAKNFKVIDTIKDFKLDLPSGNTYIKSLLLRSYVSNGFPTDASVQVIFTDSLYKPIDSLYTPGQLLMPSGVVNSSGIVIVPSQRTQDCSFDKTRIDNLKNTRRALVVGVVSTYKDNSGNYKPVKIYSNYGLDIKVGIQAVLNVKISQ